MKKTLQEKTYGLKKLFHNEPQVLTLITIEQCVPITNRNFVLAMCC